MFCLVTFCWWLNHFGRMRFLHLQGGIPVDSPLGQYPGVVEEEGLIL